MFLLFYLVAEDQSFIVLLCHSSRQVAMDYNEEDDICCNLHHRKSLSQVVIIMCTHFMHRIQISEYIISYKRAQHGENS